VARLRLAGRSGFGGAASAEVKLRRKVDVAAIRGGILQVTAHDRDPAFAYAVVAAYVDAIKARSAALNLAQASSKRLVATNRLSDASAKLSEAEAATDQFRSANKLAAPEAQFGAAVTQLAILQGKLQAEQVQLNTLNQFATPNNFEVKAAEAAVGSLQSQIAQAQIQSEGRGGLNLTGMAAKTTEYFNLYRNQKFAEALYEIYSRALEKVTVDELSASNTLDVIEPPYVDPARQYNASMVGLLALLVLFAVVAEFYVVAPPVGRKP
jgi:capsule polysaccharide export protein KpsE/RkpR